MNNLREIDITAELAVNAISNRAKIVMKEFINRVQLFFKKFEVSYYKFF